VTTSSVHTVTIIANVLPEVALTNPSNNTSFTEGSTISLAATATDRDGTVNKVEFYYGNSRLGEDQAAPYNFLWNNVPAGNYSITARAIDNNSGVTNSVVVKVIVTSANQLPVVKITSPANNSNHVEESSVIISVTASDSDGVVTKVEFFNGTIKIGEDISSPYSLTWNNLKEGSYNLVAKATDDKGGSSTAQVVILVSAVGIAPVANAGEDVTLQLPENSFAIQGSGNDADGDISNYSWEQTDGPNQATVTTNAADGSVNISNLQEGTYRFVLTVTDNGNLTGTDEIVVQVIPASMDQRVQLPKVFTPNNDGIEDTWNWSDTEPFESCKLTIYNRFGQKIYESISYDNSWDGSVNGSPLQEDAYYYVITCDNEDLTGAVRIVR
jgi:gliding motility-associated-like protein